MRQIKDLEVTLHQYEVRTNQERLYQLLHPEFMEIGYSGERYNYATIVTVLLAEKRPNYILWSQDFEHYDLTPNAKLLLYKSARLHTDGNLTHHASRCSVWVNEKGDWQIKFHQAVPITNFK